MEIELIKRHLRELRERMEAKGIVRPSAHIDIHEDGSVAVRLWCEAGGKFPGTQGNYLFFHRPGVLEALSDAREAILAFPNPPKDGDVTVLFSSDGKDWQSEATAASNWRMTYQMRGGKPDCDSIKMETI